MSDSSIGPRSAPVRSLLPEEFHELARRVNNWGRWGNDDEIGTLNLITPELVSRAAGLVRSGRSISLALPLSEEGPQTGAVPGRTNPERTMTMVNDPVHPSSPIRVSDDVVRMGLQAATHWDSLAHATYEGRMYNGFPPDSIDASGTTRCGIDKIKTLVGRGVLLDVARARGVDRIEGAIPLTGDDLDAAAEFGRVKVGPADVVLIRTGQMQLFKEGDRKAYASPA
ncbi:MAG TPA: cyclase family protein, partial [Actinomycetota bacterium]|nr:cyclase family protein [Actinomycetota bacterium]